MEGHHEVNVIHMGWRGQERDLFSDGRTDTDKSVSYQLLLDMEDKGKGKSEERVVQAAVT
ncbi:hypothetical protein A2U01_0108333, partial [Trifolium medium]|nr:hypothetical protein [Trifolium medium]